jgi:hypothetical protein
MKFGVGRVAALVSSGISRQSGKTTHAVTWRLWFMVRKPSLGEGASVL